MHLWPFPSEAPSTQFRILLKPHYFFTAIDLLIRPHEPVNPMTKTASFQKPLSSYLLGGAPCPLSITLKIVAINKKKSAGTSPTRYHFSVFLASLRLKRELKQRRRGRRRQQERRKSNRFRLAKQQFSRITLFCTLPSLHDYEVKIPNFTFCSRREHNTTTFFFFSRTSIRSFRIHLQLPTRRIERDGISAIKVEAARIHL